MNSLYLLIVVLFLTFAFVIVRFRKKFYRRHHFKSHFGKKNYKFLTFTEPVPFNLKYPIWENQTLAWKQRMQFCGTNMKKSGVQKIIFLSGTFVGSDPFELTRWIQTVAPIRGKMLAQVLEVSMKKGINSFVQDKGNFDPKYITLFSQSIGNSLGVKEFVWSSANHHFARIMGAIELLELLTPCEGKVLLIGHSHAGQLFALLTQMLSSSATLMNFIKILNEVKINSSELIHKIKKLKTLPIDFVTLGTPVRYQWAKNKSIRIMHVINHRGEEPIGGRFSGLATTRDGDYIQQLGIAGSDVISPLKLHRQLNVKLNEFLGAGVDLSIFKQSIKNRRRLHDLGINYLINYQDGGKIPNYWKTFFGHAIYTRYQTMLFHTELICSTFYE